MAAEIKHRRGSAAATATFTGASGELTVNTTTNELVVHDGSTQGGYPAVGRHTLAGVGSDQGTNIIHHRSSIPGAVDRSLHATLSTLAVNVMDFGADPTGVSDSYPAFLSAVSAGMATVDIPPGRYLLNSSLTVPDNVTLVGRGCSISNNVQGAVTLYKSGSLTGPGIVLAGACAGMRDLTVQCLPGNVGDGVVITGGRCTLSNVAVFAAGNDGIRIGQAAAGGNSNVWMLHNIKSKNNTRHGLMLSDKLASAPGAADCNGGTLLHADLQSNGGDGIYLENTQLNTFIGAVSQSNGGNGINFSANAKYNCVYGGDFEGNLGKNILTNSASTRNIIQTPTVFVSTTTLGGNNYVQIADFAQHPFGVKSSLPSATTNFPLAAENPGNSSNGRGVGLLLRTPDGAGLARDSGVIIAEQETTNKDYVDIGANLSGIMTRMLRLSPNQAAVTPYTTSGLYSLGTATYKWGTVNSVNITLSPPASVTPANNGEVSLQLTSDTVLTFKVRGADGVVRSGSITLA